jgi:RNA polymerase sigma-70 factor (ECF subfamily)
MSELKDEEIASRVQKGETFWFGMLVERYEPKLGRYARKFFFEAKDAEDLIQDIFIKAYTNIQSFDASRRFSPWIYRIAHNEFINALKKKKNEAIPLFDTDVLLPHIEEEEPEESIPKELLDKLLGKIDVKYREVLHFFYFEEMDYKEISDVLHIPISTVGVRLKRGREALKKEVDKLKENPKSND